MRWLCALILTLLSVRGAELTLEIEPRWNGQPLAIPSPSLVNAHGQPVRVTRLSALLSGVTLLRADGSTVTLTGQYGFIDVGDGRLACTLSGVPDGAYVGIGYDFGLPPTENHGDPGQWPAGHALNPLVNHLHWSWKGGYIFLAMEGHWETGAASGDADRGFSYHIAGDRYRIPIRFAALWTVQGDTTVRFAFDLARVFGGQALAVGDGSTSTHSADNDHLVGTLVANVRRAVFWLGSHPSPPRPTNAPAAAVAVHGHPVAFAVPPGFPAPSLPADNPLTSEGVALGAALFTDRRLSGTGTQSCADCHHAQRAFSDTVAFSRGADGKPGIRNAMPLFNLAWAGRYTWDGGKARIRDQARAAMTNPVEMHADVAKVAATLQADAGLVDRFAAAFGTREVTPDRIGLALEQYLLTQVSAKSKFDRAMQGKESLTEQEKEGFALFMTEYDPARGRRGADCFHCHGGALFTDYDYKNNGLSETTRAERGRENVTGSVDDRDKFRTPSLRNVALTAPYMHDGRFKTLDDVVAHYDHGVTRSATLDPNLAKHPDAGLQLTRAEQDALVAFLKTLTDEP